MLYRLDDIAFTPLNDAENQLTYAQSGRAVDTMLVDGEVVRRDGRLTGIDAGIVNTP